jgi:hypothetical protein
MKNSIVTEIAQRTTNDVAKGRAVWRRVKAENTKVINTDRLQRSIVRPAAKKDRSNTCDYGGARSSIIVNTLLNSG